MPDHLIGAPTPTRTTPTPFDVKAARYLHKNLVRHGLVLGAPRVDTTWANEIRLLRRHVAEAEIRHALTWYVRHLRGPRVPEAFAASTFRAKFQAIQSAMAIDAERNPPPVTLTQAVYDIDEELGGLHWSELDDPAVAKARQYEFTQRSIDNVTAWLEALKRAYAATVGRPWLNRYDAPQPPPAAALMEEVLHRCYVEHEGACGIARDWLVYHRQLMWRLEKEGKRLNLLKHVWTPRHPHALCILARWTRECTGRAEDAEELLAQVEGA